MRRHWFNAIAGASLVLCVTAAGFFTLSYHKPIWIQLGPRTFSGHLIVSENGEVEVVNYLFRDRSGQFAVADYGIAVPYILIVTTLAILPLLWIIILWRRRRHIAGFPVLPVEAQQTPLPDKNSD